jgi:hypothetical protein
MLMVFLYFHTKSYLQFINPLLPSTEVKDVWSFTSMPPCTSMTQHMSTWVSSIYKSIMWDDGSTVIYINKYESQNINTDGALI